MEHYNDSLDYKKLHLEWIKANRGFRPKRGVEMRYSSYLEEMTDMYYNDGIKFNKTAYIYLRDDYNHSKASKSINEEVAVMFGDKPINTNPTFFVTFNWNDENFKIPVILKALEKLFSKSWIDEARGVFEYHGLHGNHPHFMCLIQVNKHKSFGRFKDKILQSAIAQTLGKNFIDIKIAKSFHQDYLDLDKSVEKEECLKNDCLWRISLGLHSEYKK